MPRRRILFVAEAVTLAHVARSVALARSLDPSVWDVRLATDSRWSAAVGPLPFAVEPVWTIAPERFRKALDRGSPIYDVASLDRYVDEELRLLDAFRPDVVVGDFRISLGISARKAGIPYVNIANAYWSPYARVRNVVPEIALAQALPLGVAQVLFGLFRGVGYALHALPVNRVRRRHGLAPLPPDFRWAIVDGDATLYADIPAVIPMDSLPEGHRFVGPIAWSAPVALPEWWAQVVAESAERPVVYVNLGSSGVPGGLARVLEALRSMPVTVIAVTAGRQESLAEAPNTLVAEYLPGDACARVASVVVCNGGSPTTYQALAAGKPVIGLATNADQFLNMTALADTNCGILMRGRRATVREIQASVSELLHAERWGENARTFRDVIAGFDPPAEFRAVVERLLLKPDLDSNAMRDRWVPS